MHVLFIPSWYPNSFNPFGGSYVREQVQLLRKSGIKTGVIYNGHIYIANIQKFRKRFDRKIKEFIDEGSPVFKTETLQLSEWIFPKNIVRKMNQKRNNNKLEKLFLAYVNKYGKPDLMHAHSHFPGSGLKILSGKYGIPYIITEHWSGFRDALIFASRAHVILPAYAGASKLIAVSEGLANLMLRHTGYESMVIPNGVQIDTHFKTVSKKPEFTIVAVGLDSRIKDFSLAVRAFSMFAHKYDDIFLRFIGGGKEDSDLQDLITEYQLSDRIHFTGPLNRKTTLQEIHSSHILLSTSPFETFGITIVEGMAAGLPVVAIPSCGPDGIITSDELGCLSRPNPTDIAKDLVYIYKNYKVFNPEKIHKYAYDNFDANKITLLLKALYEGVISE